jgi:Predicted transcriptional regulator
MKISSRFSIAVHIIVIIALMSENQKITSSYLSECINVNPVILRKILGQLKRAELIDVKSGKGGATLLKNPNEISLIDIYRAVEAIEEISLFNSHNRQEVKCPIDCKNCPLADKKDENGKKRTGDTPNGCTIHVAVDEHLFSAQKAMEASLKTTTIEQIINKMIAAPNPKD